MDSEQLKQMLSSMVPFNRHLGLEVLDVGLGHASVRLPEAPHLLNHVGTQHAAALYSVAEAASGGAVIGAFADRVGSVTPLAREAHIRYLKPARGPITAEALIEREIASINETLDQTGRVDLPVHVALKDGAGVKVAEVTVGWHLRKNRQ
jgi:acyl-coenzyme A thioesterase PaaI-like protein